jgi:hypothetical protein
MKEAKNKQGAKKTEEGKKRGREEEKKRRGRYRADKSAERRRYARPLGIYIALRQGLDDTSHK